MVIFNSGCAQFSSIGIMIISAAGYDSYSYRVERGKYISHFYFNFYFKNLENVFIRFCFFKSKFINHLVVIHFRFSFKNVLTPGNFSNL